MQIIKRKMEVTVSSTNQYGYVQASFNSSGSLTLRTSAEVDKDEIIVFSERETEAIFRLFKTIKTAGMKLDELPF